MGKNKKIAIILTIALILECLLVIGGKTSEAAGTTLKVTSPKSVAINCSITIKTNVKAKFSTSNKKIATVNSKGVVKGKKEGTVKITVTSKSNKEQKKTITIKVKNQLVVTTPENSKATLYVGDTVKIKTNLSSKYKSSDTSVATVSSSGKVTAKKVGTAKITVTSKNNKKLKKTVTIIVEDKSFSTTTEQATTQQNTTEQDTSEIITPNPGATTEDTTAGSTTEKPTTETPSTEEPVPIGITAKYKGVIPSSASTSQMGIDAKLQYDNGTEVPIDSNKLSYSYKETKDDYGVYTVTYLNYITEMKIYFIDVGDTPYPMILNAYYNGDTIKKGETPKLEDISAEVGFTDNTVKSLTSDDIYIALRNDDSEDSRYRFFVVYEYWFEYEGQQMYGGISAGNLYVPYEE